jgi:hypothetical protein
MDQELAFRIINKRKVVEVTEETQLPVVVRAKVTNANKDYRNPKVPSQIGILNFALMTNWHLQQASNYIKEGEYQLALNCQCSRSVFEGDYFPEKGSYADVSLDYVELVDKETGEISQALMIVAVQAPTISKTTNAAEKLKMLLTGTKTVNEDDIFATKKKMSV